MSMPVNPQTGEISYIHPHHRRINIDGSYDLSAVLIEVAQRVLCHFAASILNNFNLLHYKTSCFFICFIC